MIEVLPRKRIQDPGEIVAALRASPAFAMEDGSLDPLGDILSA